MLLNEIVFLLIDEPILSSRTHRPGYLYMIKDIKQCSRDRTFLDAGV